MGFKEDIENNAWQAIRFIVAIALIAYFTTTGQLTVETALAIITGAIFPVSATKETIKEKVCPV